MQKLRMGAVDCMGEGGSALYRPSLTTNVASDPPTRGLIAVANLKSQIKRNRQTVAQTARNKALRSEVRTRSRRALEVAESGDSEAADVALRAAKKQIDIATSRGILHRNTASRRKSRLEHRVRQLLSG